MTEKEVEQQSQDETPKARATGKSHLIPIAGGIIVFVLAIVIFSLKFGVFSSSNVKEGAISSEDTTAAIDSSHQAESAEASSDPYRELFEGFDGTYDDEMLSDTAAVRDSIEKANWYIEQKNEIDRKMAQMNIEKIELNQLKSQVEALLDRKKALEEGNVIQMAKLYEGMNTDELVPILTNLDDAQVSVLISKMKKQKASEVLGKMAPERAAKITKYILSMNN